jgi:hypothetical protein
MRRKREHRPANICGLTPKPDSSMFDLAPPERQKKLREFYEFMEFQNFITFEELYDCHNSTEAIVLALTRKQKLEEQARNNCCSR